MSLLSLKVPEIWSVINLVSTQSTCCVTRCLLCTYSREKAFFLASLFAATDLLETGLDEGGVVCDGARRDGDVGEHLDLEVGREGVREAHVPREGGEDEVAHLRE